MLWIAAVAAMAAPTPQNTVRTSVGRAVQAQATVRIISGAQIHFGGNDTSEVPLPRDRMVRTATGLQPARLVEFE